MRSLLSARDVDRGTSDRLLARAERFLRLRRGRELDDRVIGLLFYSDSLRTRVGFEVAAARLGARTVVVHGPRHTPVMSAPESIRDAVRSIAGWCDALCVRHPDASTPAELATLVDVPLINCGNGEDEHPSQALADLFAISRFRGSIDGVRIGVVGDLVAMRAAHSLVMLLGNYRNVFLRCVAPPGLEMPQRYLDRFAQGTNVVEQSSRARLDDVDVVYVAGLPRHTSAEVSDEDRERLAVTRDVLDAIPSHARILCPLPRIDEIDEAVDATPQACYFEQSRLALPMRMAILAELLSGRPADGGNA